MTTLEGAMQERFDLSRVIGNTFGLVGRNFVPFLVMALILTGAPTAAQLFLQTSMVTRGFGGGLGDVGTLLFISFAVTLLGAMILQAALTRAAIDDLSGRGVSIGAALGAGFRFFFPLLGLFILMMLAMMVGFMLFIVPGIMLAMRWVVSTPSMVTEKKGITGAMGRSAELTRSHRWAIFGLCLIYIIALYAATITAGLISGIWMGAMLGGSIPSPVALIVMPLTQSIVSMIGTVGVAVIYFELRRIKEGVDVKDLVAVFE